MLKIALIGAGKMGLSHLSILGGYANTDIVGVCDTSKMVTDFLSKQGKFNCFSDYNKMIAETKPDAVVVSVPTKFHYAIIRALLEKNIHVFAEKPFCLNYEQSEELVALAAKNNLVNQVGYHNKFIGTFKEVKRIVASGALGDIYHFIGESYGPVVVRKKADTWRSDPAEGGGCLLDYASHVIDLVNDILAPIQGARGTLLKSIYSGKVEDAVYSMLELQTGQTGLLSVNWSDDTYRKMSTSITLVGTKGKLISDANELKVFFRDEEAFPGYSGGWNVKYITDLQEGVDFYLRGEEYSAQLVHFVKAAQRELPNTINNFASAARTDKAISIIKKSA
ncbi:MAG: Gfo/Idh/MocA family oxidoreductase [Ferruginibacter sp.]